VVKAAEKISKNKEKMIQESKKEGKRKLSEIGESDNEVVENNNIQNEMETDDNESNIYKGIIGSKDYLKYCINQMKTNTKLNTKRLRKAHLSSGRGPAGRGMGRGRGRQHK